MRSKLTLRSIHEIELSRIMNDHDFTKLGVRIDLDTPYQAWGRRRQMEIFKRWFPEICIPMDVPLEEVDLSCLQELKAWLVVYQPHREQAALDKVWANKPSAVSLTQMYLPERPELDIHIVPT
jgi:hypothetical protein